MRFLYEDEFNPSPGRARELRGWLADHDEKLRLACPPGVAYLGAYSVVHTTAPESSDIRVDWGMESGVAMAAFESAAQGPSELHQLLDELHRFADRASRSRGAETVLASMVDQ